MYIVNKRNISRYYKVLREETPINLNMLVNRSITTGYIFKYDNKYFSYINNGMS